jgi:hypothetical protein
MTNTHCIFCGGYKPKSKEHILPKWLQTEVMGSTKAPHKGTHIVFPWSVPVSERKHSGETLVYGKVCKECNNGWMNDLELSSSPLIKDVICNETKSKPWSLDNVNLVSKWVWKTVMMINYGSNYRKIIPENHFQYLFNQQSILDGVLFDIAFLKNSVDGIEWRQSQNFALLGKGENIEGKRIYSKDSYIFGLAINKLLFRVVYWPDYSVEVNPRKSLSMERFFPRDKKIQFGLVPIIDSIEKSSMSIVLYN